MMGGISAAGEKFLRVSRVGVWAVRVVGKKVHGFLRRGCRITPVANPTYEAADRNAGNRYEAGCGNAGEPLQDPRGRGTVMRSCGSVGRIRHANACRNPTLNFTAKNQTSNFAAKKSAFRALFKNRYGR